MRAPGTLLLAKEVLIRKAPNAAVMDVLATKFSPIPDGKGGVTLEANSKTIDFNELGERFPEVKHNGASRN
jgi:hypothetical protein